MPECLNVWEWHFCLVPLGCPRHHLRNMACRRTGWILIDITHLATQKLKQKLSKTCRVNINYQLSTGISYHPFRSILCHRSEMWRKKTHKFIFFKRECYVGRKIRCCHHHQIYLRFYSLCHQRNQVICVLWILLAINISVLLLGWCNFLAFHYVFDDL